ncbi:MAG: oligosaccharide flippase family protein [Anaerolineales bacterium]|nr:oligosaccharide flippase family protein [Anaerolineales bacterium]
MSLARRSISSISWNAIASLFALPVGVIQYIVLARLLPVEYFGIVAGIGALVALSGVAAEFGLNSAFLHRSAETEDEDQAAALYFTLRLCFEAIWMVLLITYGTLFLTGLQLLTLVVLTITGGLSRAISTPSMLLIRRVQHRRLAVLDLTTSLIVALLSMAIAFLSASIWALLIASVVSLVWRFIGLYLWKPVWKPRLALTRAGARYFLSFGGRTVVSSLLDASLDNLDDLWARSYLGNQLLGFYARAYRLAIFPRNLLAMPVNQVISGAYAELKFDRPGLSRAFDRTIVLLTRTGFFLAGGLAVTAPHLIPLLIGERWIPMVSAFQWMLVFSLLDPIKVAISGVLVAVGRPEKVILVRIVQLITLVGGLFLLGSRYQVDGVALAMDGMILVGIGLSLALVKPYIDFSPARLLLAPLVGLGIGVGLAIGVAANTQAASSHWLGLILKGGLFSCGYLAALWLIEKENLRQVWNELVKNSSWVERIRPYINSGGNSSQEKS